MGGNVEQLITETKGGKAEGLQWGALHTAELGVGVAVGCTPHSRTWGGGSRSS